MAKQMLLVSILLVFLGWPVCAWEDRGVSHFKSAAASNEAATEGETPTADLFGTPSVGYVFEPEAQAFRPIHGTPGAAVFGSKMEFGMNVRRAWVSPHQSFVLAEVDESPEVLLLDLQRGAQATKTLSALPTGADQVAVSPTGTAMAFYFRNGNRLQIASGLPDSPEVSAGIDLAVLPGLLSSLAVSDDGRAALVAVTDAGTAAVYLIHSEQKRVIAQAGDVRAMTFLTNSLNAVIADTAANEVRLLNDVTGAAATQILAEESRGISHPLALQVSADNSRVFVLNSGAQAVTTVDLTTGLLTHLPINGSASRLQRLSGEVFQLTDDLRQPMLLLDAASPEPRIVFVPRVASESSNGRSAFRDRVSDKRRPLPLR
jgi:hypothetical protein